MRHKQEKRIHRVIPKPVSFRFEYNTLIMKSGSYLT
jgi:hypothetical protein